MGMYLLEFAYTPEAWATLAKRPQDRAAAFGDLVGRAGGRLVSFYYSFGEYDGVAIFEAPDEKSAYGINVAATTPGHLKAVRTVRLLTVEETMDVLRTTGGLPYQAPAPKVPFGGLAPG